MTRVNEDPLSRVNRAIVWMCSDGRPRFLAKLVQFVFHVELPALTSPVRLPHPYCVVVNPKVRLGRNVTLYQGVTLGGKRTGRRAGVPQIGDGVVIFPNAVVVGAVFIGDGAQVGPGAVVNEDVPAGATVVGNPAKRLVIEGS